MWFIWDLWKIICQTRLLRIISKEILYIILDISKEIHSPWKVSVFGVFLVHIFPHSDWIWRDTLNTDTFQAVTNLMKLLILVRKHCTKNEVFCGRKLRIWLHLLEKSLMKNFIFCAVKDFLLSVVNQKIFMSSE